MAEQAPWETGITAPSEPAPWETGIVAADLPTDTFSKSNRRKAQNQLAVLMANPDFQSLPKSERDRLEHQAKGHVTKGKLKDLITNPAGGDIGLGLVKEAATLGLEGLNATGQALQRGLTSLDESAKFADTALGTSFDREKPRGLDAAFSQFKNYEENYQPISTPVPEGGSAVGGALGHYAIEPVSGSIQDTEWGKNDPRLAQKILDITTLVGARKPLASTEKFVTQKGPGLVREAAVDTSASLSNAISPRSKPRAGAPTDALGPAVDDMTQQKIVRQHQKNPQVTENRFDNAVDALAKPERIEVDPRQSAKLGDKARHGLDELEQQSREGRVFEHDARGEIVVDATGKPVPYSVGKGGVAAAFMPVTQMLDNLWKNEVLPVLERAKVQGVKASMNEVAAALESKANAYGGALGNSLRARAKELHGTSLNPIELQNRATVLNEIIYGGKNKLPIEDTILQNALRQELGAINDLLDKVVDTHLEGQGLASMKGRWGAGSRLRELIMDGIEKKTIRGKGLDPNAVTSMAQGLAGAKFGRPSWMVHAATKIPSIYKRWMGNPDVAFETMIRSRRAAGNTTRETFNGQIRPPSPTEATAPGMGDIWVDGKRVGGSLGDIIDPRQGRPLGLEEGGIPPMPSTPRSRQLQLSPEAVEPVTGPRGSAPVIERGATPEPLAGGVTEPHPTTAGQPLSPKTVLERAPDMRPPAQFPRVPVDVAEPHPSLVQPGSLGDLLERGTQAGNHLATGPRPGSRIVTGETPTGLTGNVTPTEAPYIPTEPNPTNAGQPALPSRAGLKSPLSEQMQQAAAQNLDPKVVDQFWRAVDAGVRNNNGKLIETMARRMGFTSVQEAKRILKQVDRNGGGSPAGVGKPRRVNLDQMIQAGVPIAVITAYLLADDETKQRMMGLPVMAGILSYHGSPVSGIQKFSNKFRGTGEGRLPVGSPMRESFKDMIAHGNYTAGDVGIAKGYQKRLSASQPPIIKYKGVDIDAGIRLWDDVEDGAIKILRRSDSVDKAVNEAIFSADHWDKVARETLEPRDAVQAAKKAKILDYLVTNKSKFEVIPAKPGSVYTTELLPHPDEFLHWDKPLSEQPKVLKKLRAAGMFEHGGESGYTGRSLHQQLAQNQPHQAVAEYLHSLGIKGVKYLDANSRGGAPPKYTPAELTRYEANIKDIASRLDTLPPEWKGRLAEMRARYKQMVEESTDQHNYVTFEPEADTVITHENGVARPEAIKEAYRNTRDLEGKKRLAEEYRNARRGAK